MTLSKSVISNRSTTWQLQYAHLFIERNQSSLKCCLSFYCCCVVAVAAQLRYLNGPNG